MLNAKTGIIILAAGNSSRLGRAKQLLMFNGKPLLANVVDEAAKAGLHPIITVLGFDSENIAAFIDASKSEIVINSDWQQGMASGIVAGINRLLELKPDIESVIIAVSDQPFVSAELFTRLITKQQETGKQIIASLYAGTPGVPVLFTPSFFSHLQNLKGDAGAKSLLKAYLQEVATVDFEQGIIDIDTTQDYDALLYKKSGQSC